MAIDQSKLDALKTLASGGSAGLDAYRQAQAGEQASRTDALKNALGGQDVYQAAQAAQAKYAPTVVGSPFADASNLSPAANQFLSQGANKLANKAYEQQADLTLQAENLRRAGDDKYRKEMLQGAANAMGQQQAADVQNQFSQEAIAQNLAKRNELLGQQSLEAYSQGLDLNTPEGRAEAVRRQEANQAAMTANDQAAQAAFQRYAGALGLDTRGLEEAYRSGDQAKMADLLGYLGNQATPKKEEAIRRIETEDQKRLRELAPAFGINPLVAEGLFPESKSTGIKEALQREETQGYISGQGTAAQRRQATAEQKAADAEAATALNFSSSGDYARAKNTTGMNDDQIQAAMTTPEWDQIDEIVQGFLSGDTNITGERSGKKGFQERINEFIGSGHDVVNGQDVPWPKEVKDRLNKLANSYYNSQAKSYGGTSASGKGSND